MLWGEPGEASSATILAEMGEGRYLIQLDQRGPREPLPPDAPANLVGPYDQASAMRRDVDLQEPLEVQGDSLEFVGEWEWADNEEDS